MTILKRDNGLKITTLFEKCSINNKLTFIPHFLPYVGRQFKNPDVL